MRRTLLSALTAAALLLSAQGCTESSPTSPKPAPGGATASAELTRSPPVRAGTKAEPAPVEGIPADAPRGTIEGHVKLDGAIPQLAALKTSGRVSPTCADALPDPSLRAAGDGSLAGVIVSVEAPAQPAPTDLPEVIVDQKGCLYTPVSLAARAGSTLTFLNSDPLLHNVRAATAGRSLFNVAMPIEGMKVKKSLPKKADTVEIRCDVHPWMHAFVRTFEHPWFAVTDEEGKFRIEGVPVGAKTLTFWHPRFPELTREVRLDAGATAAIELAVPASSVSAEPFGQQK